MSSGKKVVENVRLFTDGAMASTNTITSSVINTLHMDKLKIGLVWTGTPNGTFVVQAPVGDGTNWQTITTDPATISASGSAGSHVIHIDNWAAESVRVQYTNSSSSGTLQGYLTAKES